MHPAIVKGNIAVVTGGASGIGLAAAARLAEQGLKVCIADLPGEALDVAKATLIASGVAAGDVMTLATDVADLEQLRALEARVSSELGPVNVLMNNAGMQPGSSIFDAEDNWQRIIDVNMWGVIRGSQVFAPGMIASGLPGLIVNTGSKQGITTPPGDPAYNVSKTGVKAFTEALQHELRNLPDCRVEARLFIPGFVFTPLTARGRIEKPEGAWTPEQTVSFLFERIEAGDFYILCPDNEVDRPTDEKRIAWAAGDITENRPPLSRWHPDFDAAFQKWLKS
ncbi:SDR family NAD(P)-dependent oxidoreductase [Aliiruegeria lutimaris]|uniref:NAD(P)-dependent dehydrogenase, short-chain alcohol dehydrogenase family n=1 Tax=Aliiruegeria lutimaris TaxID=571298 RepID=A0A1G9F2Q9_9RHOB|nr:SDR family NAD(P)-dependent oxidoreductase [Aliiruegeria lutimaris]SDK82610.1 NAD(P)-dependent dehydrogenase, short-chain alcohol dehydrogenase family [Aliiruegeria lutimaris]